MNAASFLIGLVWRNDRTSESRTRQPVMVAARYPFSFGPVSHEQVTEQTLRGHLCRGSLGEAHP
jgi:hypothetical protein